MGQPRAGRKRAVVSSSDESDNNVSPAPEEISSDRETGTDNDPTTVTLARGDNGRQRGLGDGAHTAGQGQQSTPLTSTQGNTTPTPTSSPEKKKQPRPSRPAQEKAKATAGTKPKANKPIYSFFNAATQRQRASASRPRSASPEKAPQDQDQDDEDLDILDAISGDDDGDAAVPFSKGSHTASASRKRKMSHGDGLGPGGSGPQSQGVGSATQKFRKTGSGEGVKVPGTSTSTVRVEDQRPWTDQYPPRDSGELAVHKKKVTDVRNSSEMGTAVRGRPKSVVSKGAAGTGKTATVKLSAKDMGIEMMEWKNPGGSDLSSGGAYVSVSAQFEDFINRSGRFSGLSLATSDSATLPTAPSQKPPPPPSSSSGSGKQLISVEEFPTLSTTASPALQSFRTTSLSYLSTPPPQGVPGIPIVLIISETSLSATTSASDSFTAHRSLGPHLLSHPLTATVEFNPIAPTISTKALEVVVTKESRRTGRRRTPGPAVSKRSAESGDIRSAVSGLEFSCSRGDADPASWGGKVAFTKPKRGAGAAGKEVASTRQEKDALASVANREASLGIFHAVGKVVYNKRVDPSASTVGAGSVGVPQPPPFLPQHRRPKAPETDADTLLNESGTDTTTFVAASHENYALSCTAQSQEDSMDALEGCVSYLSDADSLSPDRFGGRGAWAGTATDGLRQDELAFQVAVRGVLFSSPYPVTRGAGAGAGAGRGGDRFRMLYPTSLRIWKRREEIEGLLDVVGVSVQHLSSRGGNVGTASGAGAGVESWRRSTATAPAAIPEDSVAAAASPVITNSLRSEMLLERLPYMAQICSKRPDVDPVLQERMASIVSSSGLGVAATDEEPDVVEDEAAYAGWPGSRSKERGRSGVKTEREGGGLNIPVEHDIEKLVLSDDDIVDD